MPRDGEIVFSRKEHINWFSNNQWPVLRKYIQVILYVLKRLYLGNKQALSINEMKAMDMKENKEDYRRVILEGLQGGKGRHKCNYVISSKI